MSFSLSFSFTLCLWLPLLFFKVPFSFAEAKNEQFEGVRDLKMPGFDADGRISWELFANEVNFVGNGTYEAFDVVLNTMTGFSQSNAKSKKGFFQPDIGEGKGDSLMEVDGRGFRAFGEDWLWKNQMQVGRQLIAFKENGRVFFKESLPVDAGKDQTKGEISQVNLTRSDQNESFGTLAKAEYIELLEVTVSRNRFLLEKNVDVISENLNINCNYMEIFLEKDTNQSNESRGIGRISEIFAKGKVRMNQPGRASFADEMKIDVLSGEALLLGNARVEDEEYGIAMGSKIVLERGSRKAKVIGKEGQRPSLQLPVVPDLGFPKPKNRE